MAPALAVALAFVAGYAVIVGICLTMTFALVATMPKFVTRRGRLTTAYLGFHALLWLFASVLGGYITSEFAGWSPFGVSLALALVLFASTIWSAFDLREQQPLGFQIFVSTLAAVGVVGGALLHVKI